MTVYLILKRFRNHWTRIRMKNRPQSKSARKNLLALTHLDFSRPARSYSYVVADLETTGLSLTHDRVVSIGALRLVNGRILLGDIFDELVNPGRDISVQSIKIHGIVPGRVVNARRAGEVFEDFLEYLGTNILVGHHIDFDLHFLNKIMQVKYGFPIQNLVLDTVPLCRAIAFPSNRYPHSINWDSNQCDLTSLAHHFGFEIQERHTALGDAMATAMLFQRILARLEKNGPGLLGDLIRPGALF